MMNKKTYRPYFYFLCFLILFPIILPGKFLFIAPLTGFVIMTAFDRKGLRDLGRIKFWLFISLIVLVLTFLLNPTEPLVFGIKYSPGNLDIVIKMTLRALSIYMGVILFTRNVSIEELLFILKKAGFKDFSTALPIALNVVPMLRRNTIQSITAFKIRGGFKRHRMRNLFKLMTTVFVNTVHTAEELSQIMALKESSKD